MGHIAGREPVTLWKPPYTISEEAQAWLKEGFFEKTGEIYKALSRKAEEVHDEKQSPTPNSFVRDKMLMVKLAHDAPLSPQEIRELLGMPARLKDGHTVLFGQAKDILVGARKSYPKETETAIAHLQHVIDDISRVTH
jgi:hypothetical protein